MCQTSESWGYVYVVDDRDNARQRYYLSPLPHSSVFAVGLPPEAIVGELSDPKSISQETFKPNPMFIKFLAQVLEKHANGCTELVAEAERTRNGWVYVIDKRTPTPDGAVPPEDIMGGYEVNEGRLQRFLASPNHKLVSSHGLFRLGPYFEARLIEELDALRRPK